MSPRLQSGDVLLFYVSFSLLFFHTFLSARFLGDALIKLYEYDHFFGILAVSMATAAILKKINP
jgi:hypothetical protein